MDFYSLNPLGMLFILYCLHCLGDFALQNDYIAINKSKEKFAQWYIVLSAHCAIHALLVWVVTGNIAAALLMYVSHFIIDYSKNNKRISFKTDQILHIMVLVAIVIGLNT
ncbi:DUF3307-containing protein [Acinetobacter phage SH-Ab 15599]|nr:DUF3307-containing protein [Acinetobacter phage SH-Ab 15599]